jgi:hypothetical protein
MRSTQSVTNTGRKFTFIAGGLLLILAFAIFWMRNSSAQSASYDPYADSVAGTAQVVLNADNAVGAPNGTSASLAGPGTSLTLDMGVGEEGTQALRLHLGQISAQVNVNVAFLDANKAVLTSENRQLGVDLNPSTQNFAYNWTNHKKAYRFVRVSSTLGGGVNVDAVEALGYIGSTPSQDTDGDGIPDRTEQQNGTNPLVPNPKPSTNTPAKPIPGANGTSSSDSSRSVSGQVNTPPAGSSDKDGDGMADKWEREHGLDPNDANDATKDPDHDNLNNLTEYKIGTNPQKMDTDGDGMPDGWEYEHGLNANKNDADADPDGDYLTNLGEYRNNTDPNKADDLYEVFGKNCAVDRSVWMWGIAGLLVAFLLGWIAAKAAGNNKKASKTKTSKKN